ncbi:MAG: insulinase family protein [Planctomycetota bacterium]|nr:insulinase family protein [Planctomycetota bacterium]
MIAAVEDLHNRFAGFEARMVHGCPLLFRRDQRFKTFRLVIVMQRPLDDSMAARAILPALMQHGSKRYPDRPSLARARESLYGASTGPSVGKHCETAVMRLQAEAVAGEFLPGRPDQFGDTLALLKELTLHARMRLPNFPAELFERERAQFLAESRSIFDDKGLFARQQAVSLACAGEPYAILDHGGEAAIAALDPAQPAQMLTDFLQHGRRFCVAMGALPEDVPNALGDLLSLLPTALAKPLTKTLQLAPRAVVRVREHAPMLQAKLVLILRAPVADNVASHCALQAMLSLWGGGTHSRLFREVRERLSLCYSASTSSDIHKGIVLVQSGCESSKVEAVAAESLRQLDELRAGRFSDQELTTVIATITGAIAAIDDSLASRLSFTAGQWLLENDQDPQQRIASYLAVSREQVVAAANSLWLDHDYALLPVEEVR